MTPPLALVPLKAFRQAKERLSPLLTGSERTELALATFGVVMEALRQAGFRSYVLASDPEGVPPVSDETRVIAEQPGLSGLNAQLEAALAAPPFTEAANILILHADLPLCSADALTALVQSAPEGGVALVESTDGGTNAMLVPAAPRFPLRYGPGSFSRHKAAALQAGLPVRVHHDATLSLDLDTPADIRALLTLPAWRESSAGKLLLSWDVCKRLDS